MTSALGCRMDVSKQPMKAASATQSQVSRSYAKGTPALHAPGNTTWGSDLAVLLTDIMQAKGTLNLFLTTGLVGCRVLRA